METINENEAQDKRSLKKAFLAVVCACALTLAGVFAYLTATDQVKNLFSLADKIEIEVVEPNWNPDDAKGMLPTQTVAKDPAIHNKNKAEIYVFADVVIPQKDIVTANADGTLNESAVVDLFSYELNDGWTLKDTIANDDGTVTYRYVYDDVVPADGTTSSLFDEVTLVNYVNEQFNTEELAQQIVINGYGAQALGFANADEAYAAQFGVEDKTFTTNITVNDDSIAAGNDYEVKQVETLSTASLSTATIDDQVVFEDVELVEDAQYAIVPAGENVDNAIVEFTADETVKESSSTGLVVDTLPKAFAIYSYIDNSLSFYKRSNIPAVGDTFEGKLVGKVFEGVETTSGISVPWYRTTADVKTVTIVDEGIKPASTAYWFCSFPSLTQINGLNKLDTSNVTDMSNMFASSYNLASLDVSSFDTSNVTNMSSMFFGCEGLTALNVSNFDTSNVTDMSRMFASCCYSKIDGIENLNTSHVTNMSEMFYGCPYLEELNLSSFETSNVENMSLMFSESAFKALDLSSFNTSKVTNMLGMFKSCQTLSTIYASEQWSTASVTNSNSMFFDAFSLVGGEGTSFSSSCINASYAHIDGGTSNPGYFTAK